MQGNAFRLAHGPEKLRSAKIEKIVRDGDSFLFEGFGWGHGVGLCQWGTKTMAEQRLPYKNITSFYFPDTEITNIYAVE